VSVADGHLVRTICSAAEPTAGAPKELDLQRSSPAQLYATVAGAALVILAIVGFLYEASFDTGVAGVRSSDLLGVLTVNGWHNLFHLVAGLLGLVAANSGAARSYALGFGLLFVAVGLWGFVDRDDVILSAMPVNAAGNVLHLALGVLGLGAGAATPRAPQGRRS
jgi:hypothetical protein